MTREPLDNRRSNETTMLEFGGEKYLVTFGYYEDGRVGEVFIDRIKDKVASRIGVTLDGVCRDSAVLMSMALQFGTSVKTIGHAITRDDEGTPVTIIGAICDLIEKSK